MKQKSNSQHSPKRRYQSATGIRNWQEYNQALVQRGSLTVWLEPHILASWLNTQRRGQRGAARTYNDVAIVAALTFKVV